MSLWTPIILILFAMGEGSLTVQDIVRSPQMLDRLAAFGKPSRRYLFSDHSCFCPGKKRVHMGNQGRPHKCQTTATVGTGASLHGRSLGCL